MRYFTVTRLVVLNISVMASPTDVSRLLLQAVQLMQQPTATATESESIAEEHRRLFGRPARSTLEPTTNESQPVAQEHRRLFSRSARSTLLRRRSPANACNGESDVKKIQGHMYF